MDNPPVKYYFYGNADEAFPALNLCSEAAISTANSCNLPEASKEAMN
ncbi:MAG: hypothetical protein J6J42_13710 [Lachnospiraceae bacterium]|nr:hypothetical protein [Lachnospiraceae bacterium]